MTNSTLIENFDTAMMGIYHSALSETGYRASIFLNMLHEFRGVETARRLIHSPAVSDGYTALWELGRLDLTVEALIVENLEWHTIFSLDELLICKNRLSEYGYVSKKSNKNKNLRSLCSLGRAKSARPF